VNVNYEFGGILQEVVVAYFNVLIRLSHDGIKPQQSVRITVSRRDLNQKLVKRITTDFKLLYSSSILAQINESTNPTLHKPL